MDDPGWRTSRMNVTEGGASGETLPSPPRRTPRSDRSLFQDDDIDPMDDGSVNQVGFKY